jgi:hypothetical protein
MFFHRLPTGSPIGSDQKDAKRLARFCALGSKANRRVRPVRLKRALNVQESSSVCSHRMEGAIVPIKNSVQQTRLSQAMPKFANNETYPDLVVLQKGSLDYTAEHHDVKSRYCRRWPCCFTTSIERCQRSIWLVFNSSLKGDRVWQRRSSCAGYQRGLFSSIPFGYRNQGFGRFEGVSKFPPHVRFVGGYFLRARRCLSNALPCCFWS